MITRQNACDTPPRYYLQRVLRDMWAVSRIGLLSAEGVLSLLAAKLGGAARVYAVEAAEGMAKVARGL